MVVATGKRRRWRYSGDAYHIAYKIPNLLKKLNSHIFSNLNSIDQFITPDSDNGTLIIPESGPDSDRLLKNKRIQKLVFNELGHKSVIVFNEQVYFLIFSNSTLNYKTYQINNSAFHPFVSNGIPDWIYEEEILSSDNAIWPFRIEDHQNDFNDENMQILYWRFDDSQVKTYSYPIFTKEKAYQLNLISETEYSQSNATALLKYPRIHSIPYPKTFSNIPKITLHTSLFENDKNKIHNIELDFRNLIPLVFKNQFNDFIMQDMVILSQNEMVFRITNRNQTVILTLFASTAFIDDKLSTNVKLLRTEVTGKDFSSINNIEGDKGWYTTDVHRLFAINDIQISGDMGPFYIDNIIHNKFNHIAIFSVNDKKSSNPVLMVTTGDYDTEFISYDYKSKTIWYRSTENDPKSWSIFSFSMFLMTKSPLPLLPIIKPLPNSELSNDSRNGSSWDLYSSPLSQYAKLSYLGPNLPAYYLFDLNHINDSKPTTDNPYYLLEDNSSAYNFQSLYQVPYTFYGYVNYQDTSNKFVY